VSEPVRLSGGAGRMLPPDRRGLATGFVAGCFAFFAVMLLALGLSADRLAADWSSEAADIATLHVVAGAEAVEAQARAALEVLRTTPGVRSVRIIEIDEQRALLAPWFGADVALDALPLPLLIEVATDPDQLDRAALAERLAAEAPGAIYDDHASWRGPALATVLGLVAAAAVAANAHAVETLRLIGARDRFITAAFTRRITRDVAAGAAVGALVGLGLIATLPATGEAGFFLAGIGPSGWGWLAPAMVPLACAAIAWGAARVAAAGSLRRWS
jgi:cell division transport system permease protein